jgi:DNA-binding HxlR family transcriptional regulator
VPAGPRSNRGTGCPVSRSLEILGDRWSLLIVRDMMIRGVRNFKEFQRSGEGIASNILTGRLRKLQQEGVISSEPGETDRRRVNYRLTTKGIALAPVLFELLLWGAQHNQTGLPCATAEQMAKNREWILAEVRRRWKERDLTPLQSQNGQWHLPR